MLLGGCREGGPTAGVLGDLRGSAAVDRLDQVLVALALAPHDLRGTTRGLVLRYEDGTGEHAWTGDVAYTVVAPSTRCR